MAKNREVLQSILENILGSRNVYFQPPETVRISYPAIVYSISNVRNVYANNTVYYQDDIYNIVVIDKDPGGKIMRKVSLLPFCQFNSHYVSDNLYHDTFTIYF